MTIDQRYGVVVHTTSSSKVEFFLDEIDVDWYLDFRKKMTNVPSGKTKLPFIPVPLEPPTPWTSNSVLDIESMTEQEIDDMGFLTRQEIADMVDESPGSYWYIFGEPNRYGYITPKRWAPVFRYFITQIKLHDPSAMIVGTSMLNWDYTCVGCGGYQSGETWFHSFIEEYRKLYLQRPEVDAWAIDVYPIDWIDTPNSGVHASTAIDQLTGMRAGLDTYSEYDDVPIWITEIAVHWGYDGWTFNGSTLVPVGTYHWDNMGDYLISVLDWLEDNASDHDIEKWFFFKTWADVENPVDYAGTYFFDARDPVADLNCLGEIYRNRAIGGGRFACDADGDTIPDN